VLLICAVTPTILAALHRIRSGQEPVEPRTDLTSAANWLYMITGEVPAPKRVRAVERYLIATIDHGFNPSTFTARVVASTGADVVSAITAAIGAFSGPLHVVRRTGRWTAWTRSARSTGPTSGCGPRSPPAIASWASGTPCTAPKTPGP
jgi:hypothetical protein